MGFSLQCKELIATKRTPNVEIFYYYFSSQIASPKRLCGRKIAKIEEIETFMLGYL
jgi:hypothetical protein